MCAEHPLNKSRVAMVLPIKNLLEEQLTKT